MGKKYQLRVVFNASTRNILIIFFSEQVSLSVRCYNNNITITILILTISSIAIRWWSVHVGGDRRFVPPRPKRIRSTTVNITVDCVLRVSLLVNDWLRSNGRANCVHQKCEYNNIVFFFLTFASYSILVYGDRQGVVRRTLGEC